MVVSRLPTHVRVGGQHELVKSACVLVPSRRILRSSRLGADSSYASHESYRRCQPGTGRATDQELSITPTQATGGAGALFGLAKSRLAPSDFGKVSDAVPGMHSFLEAAPSTGGMTGLSSLAGSAPGGIGGLAAAAGSFQKLGLSPDMVSKFIPIMTKYVEGTGGSGVASLLSGALK